MPVTPDDNPKYSRLWHILPLAIIIVAAIVVYAVGLNTYFRIETLRTHRHQLVEMVSHHYAATVFAFMGIVIAVVALSIPADALLAVASGFLFHQPWATVYMVIASTIGAVIIFSVARLAISAAWRARTTTAFSNMEQGFKRNAISYLLFLRFIPFSPFWLINLLAAFFNVPFWTFAWTTLVGIIPGSFVHAQAGEGLGAILDSGQPFSLHTIFNVQVTVALIALAIFALIPVVIRKIRSRR